MKGMSTCHKVPLWCHCGATDHVKTIFGGCELNPNNIAKEQKNLVNASTAMNDITKE